MRTFDLLLYTDYSVTKVGHGEERGDGFGKIDMDVAWLTPIEPKYMSLSWFMFVYNECQTVPGRKFLMRYHN